MLSEQLDRLVRQTASQTESTTCEPFTLLDTTYLSVIVQLSVGEGLVRALSFSTTSSQSTTDATVYLCTFFFFIVFVFFQSRLVYLQQCVQQRHQQHSDNELSAICARALIRFCSSVFAAVSYSTHFKADFCYSAERELLKTSSRSSSTQRDQLTVSPSSE